ncbi:MAG: HD-GYP domain-containing protein [Planctomycetota bacterium]
MDSVEQIPESITTSEVFRIQTREEAYKDILIRLFVLLKTAQTDTSDELFDSALDELMEALHQSLAREGTLVVGERDGYLYLNGVRARLDLDGFAALKFLVQAFIGRDLSGILFEHGVTGAEFRAFLEVFLKPENESATGQGFTQLLRERGVSKIHPILRSQGKERADRFHSDPRIRPAAPQNTYFKSIFVIKQLLEGVGPSCCQTRRSSMRIIQRLSKHILDEEAFLIFLDQLRQWDFSLFKHSVNVSILSVVLGKRMGLSPTLLDDLGVAALFHDVGMVDLSFPKGERAVCLAKEERNPRKHAELSLRRLISTGQVSDLILRAALIAYCHHDKDEEPEGGSSTSLLARIVGVADSFELLVSIPDSDGNTLSPMEAVAAQRRHASSGTRPIVELLSRIVVDSTAA